MGAGWFLQTQATERVPGSKDVQSSGGENAGPAGTDLVQVPVETVSAISFALLHEYSFTFVYIGLLLFC